MALDVINPDSPEAAAKASFENYAHMRKRGLEPIPVFHVKEDISWLYRMIDAGATYIGLSASSLVSRNQVNDWYAHCWDKLTDSNGLPLIKAHAFGEGRYEAMAAFPWYSADSTSWVYDAQRNAMIPIDGTRMVAQRNDKLNDKSKPDLDSLDRYDRLVFDELLERHKINPASLLGREVVATVIRTYLALQFYLDQERRVNECCPVHHRHKGLFRDLSPYAYTKPPIHLPNIKYYSVLGNNPCAWSVLTYAGARRGLISYFYVSGGHYTSLRDFVYDPIATCSTQNPMKKSWDILKEFVNVP